MPSTLANRWSLCRWMKRDVSNTSPHCSSPSHEAPAPSDTGQAGSSIDVTLYATTSAFLPRTRRDRPVAPDRVNELKNSNRYREEWNKAHAEIRQDPTAQNLTVEQLQNSYLFNRKSVNLSLNCSSLGFILNYFRSRLPTSFATSRTARSRHGRAPRTAPQREGKVINKSKTNSAVDSQLLPPSQWRARSLRNCFDHYFGQ
jgi:hypothetical protein